MHTYMYICVCVYVSSGNVKFKCRGTLTCVYCMSVCSVFRLTLLILALNSVELKFHMLQFSVLFGCLNKTAMHDVKGLVHPQMIIYSSFTQPNVFPNCMTYFLLWNINNVLVIKQFWFPFMDQKVNGNQWEFLLTYFKIIFLYSTEDRQSCRFLTT